MQAAFPTQTANGHLLWPSTRVPKHRKANEPKIDSAKQKETKWKEEKLLVFFFNFLWNFDGYFAFSRTFRDNAKFGCRSVSSTSEGVAAFAAYPDTNALALDFDEAALWAFVGFLESSSDCQVSFADCATVSYS
jgi:hypothetical protein